ncbi:MAG: DUF1223 domain-containing protein [Burkholderiales bacterium]
MTKRIQSIFFILAAVTATIPVHAASCNAKSGPTTVALLELYTSEGCSSCPPADKWVSGLGIKSDKIVPLALHVGYWDYIGWKDVFAKPEFYRRQSEYASLHSKSGVFTPQTVLSGKNLSTGSNGKLSDALAAINAIPARADISLALNQTSGGEVEISAMGKVKAADAREQSAGYLALYENRLFSQVKAGENNGEKLNHDFVVREWIGPLALDNNGEVQADKKLSIKSEWKTANMGAAMFIQNRASGEVLQALSLPFCAD